MACIRYPEEVKKDLKNVIIMRLPKETFVRIWRVKGDFRSQKFYCRILLLKGLCQN